MTTGIELVGLEQRSNRLQHLTLSSGALGRGTEVRVLVPDGHDAATSPPLPVLWLLHGGMDDVTSWTCLLYTSPSPRDS